MPIIEWQPDAEGFDQNSIKPVEPPVAADLTYSLVFHLVYSQSMQADIITCAHNFNQLLMTRYTMRYDNIPKSLFDKFVKEECIDHSRCERVKAGDGRAANNMELEIDINVKNQNENTGGFKTDSKNINEIFKFTCQRYHSYITQIIDQLKDREMNPLIKDKEQKSGSSSARKKIEENHIGDFEFFPSTKGLGSKIKGFDKAKNSAT